MFFSKFTKSLYNNIIFAVSCIIWNNLKTDIRMKRIILAFAFLCGVLTSMATNYYCSPDGTGDGKSVSSPTTFKTGISKLSSPGDSLFLLDGVYYLSEKISINKSGNSTTRIFIGAYPGAAPILDFRNQAYGSSNPGLSINSSAQYLHLKGFTVRYAGDNGIINYGNYCLLEQLKTYGNCDTGIQHKTGGGNIIRNCDSYDNFDYLTGSDAAADFGGNADGFADKQYTSGAAGPNYYVGCRAWGNSDDGWDFYQRVTTNAQPTILDSCICYQNGPASYNLSNNPRCASGGVDYSSIASIVADGKTTDKKGGQHTCTITSYYNNGNGNGFKIGGDYTQNDITLHNCLSVNNKARGFDHNNNAGKMIIYNVSAYNNGTNYGFANTTGASLDIRNSVSFMSKSADNFKCPTLINTNNSWTVSGVTVSNADFLNVDTTTILHDRNADGTLYETGFMFLAESSDLINKGVDVGLPYSGSAPDLGYREYGEVENYPPGLSTTSATSQYVKLGASIENMVFKYSGGATSASVTDLPEGLSSNLNTTQKTLTISGTPVATGSYSFTVSSVGGTGSAVNINCSLLVKSADVIYVAYCTTDGNDAADTKILEAINASTSYMTQIVNLTSGTTNDYSSYDLIVVSSVPSSSASGMADLEQYVGFKPMLLLKPWCFKVSNKTWSWGTAINTSDRGVKLTGDGLSHSIFNGYALSDLALFSSVNTNSVTAVTHTTWSSNSVVSSNDILVLATPTSNEGADAIFEIPVGTSISGTPSTAKFINIGLSESSSANLNADAQRLIRNACDYLLGKNPSETLTDIQENTTAISEINTTYYDINGNEINENATGIIIKVTTYSDGSHDVEKILK